LVVVKTVTVLFVMGRPLFREDRNQVSLNPIFKYWFDLFSVLPVTNNAVESDLSPLIG